MEAEEGKWKFIAIFLSFTIKDNDRKVAQLYFFLKMDVTVRSE